MPPDVVGRFFVKKTEGRLREAGAREFLEDAKRLQWDGSELKALHGALVRAVEGDEENCAKEVVEYTISYEGFLKARKEMLQYLEDKGMQRAGELRATSLGAPGMSHTDFFVLKELMNSRNRIPVMALYEQQFSKMTLFQTRLELQSYEALPGCGYLTPQALEQYILALSQDGGVPMPSHIDPVTFPPYYACSVTRRMLWVLDPGRRRRVKTEDLMRSVELKEFMLLPFEKDPDGPLSPARQELNYVSFLSLSEGSDTMTAEQMGRYGGLTKLFVERVFEVMGVVEMDYSSFVDFLLTVEHINSDQVVPFVFKVLDLHSSRTITPMSLHRFLTTANPTLDPETSASVVTELIDMIAPPIPLTITQQDLLSAGAKRRPFLAILLTHSGYQVYEAEQGSETSQWEGSCSDGLHDAVQPMSIVY